MLREFTDAVLALLERHTALRLDPAWVDVAVAGSVLFLVLLSLVTAIVRLRARLRQAAAATVRALTPVQAAPPEPATPLVKTLAPSKPTPEPIQRPVAPAAPPSRLPPAGAPQTARSISAAPRREDSVPPSSTETRRAAATAPPGPAQTLPASAPPPALTAQQRKDLALAVRDAVLAKVAEGGWFKDGAEPLTYRFNRVSLTRMQFEILLELPSPGGSPRSGHALHVTVDGRKKLNLEWGTGSGPGAGSAARVRFLSPGDWTAAITSWNFADNRPPLVTPVARKRA